MDSRTALARPCADMDELLECAARLRPGYERAVAGIPFEAKGVLYSEMLFLVAALRGCAPPRVLESGRARGQSTLLLSHVLPDTPITSWELHDGTEDARVCAERLAGRDRVELRFGDARAALPEAAGEGDAVVIDGPKGLRGLELAMRTLRGGRVSAVFVHDCNRGSEERRWLDAHDLGALYSDDERFIEAHRDLDARCHAGRSGVEGGWTPHHFDGRAQASYGPTYACLPGDPARPYAALLRDLAVRRFLARTGRSVRKRLFGRD